MNKINYELFIEIVRNEQKINIYDAESIVDSIINNSQNDVNEYGDLTYEESNYKKLYDIAVMFEDNNITFLGNADNYHNLSVSYAKEDCFDSACKILNKGIEEYPYSVDLLADFLKYGIQWKKYYSLCEKYYERLKSISFSEWNWRAYSFSIDYLLDKKSRNYSISKEIKSEALSLADKFIYNASLEYLDQAYFDKSTIYKSYGEDDKEKETLEFGANNSTRASKCCLRLSDIEFNSGNYKKAIDYIERCWRVLDTMPRINRGYTFLLLALSKTSEFLKDFDAAKDIDDVSEKEIELLYKDFNSALDNVDGIYKDTIKTVVRILEAQTGVKNKFNNQSDFEF